MIPALLLALAGAPDGFGDQDLPRFAPARVGMVRVFEWRDGYGKLRARETSVTQQVDRPDGTLGRLVCMAQSVVNGRTAAPRLAEGTIWPDRLEAADLESSREPTLELHTPLRPGNSWTYPLTGGVGRRTIQAIEPVTVGAGTYPRALRVHVEARFEQDGERVATTSDVWYVPDVGVVKALTFDGAGRPRSSLELVGFRPEPKPRVEPELKR